MSDPRRIPPEIQQQYTVNYSQEYQQIRYNEMERSLESSGLLRKEKKKGRKVIQICLGH